MGSSVFQGMAAFFPWAALAEPIILGSSIRLLPYRVGKLPGDLERATQSDLDGIMKAYSDRRNVRVSSASILEVDAWQTGIDDAAARERLFRARIAIGFAALAERHLFSRQDVRCNYDAYTLIVQRYTIGDPAMFSFTTRRRDGYAVQIWGSTDFAFQRPLHVDLHTRIEFDRDLAQRLFELPTDASISLFEALTEFNSANTDSSDVAEHVEVVMLKSAFEWLLNIKEKWQDFAGALDSYLPESNREPCQTGALEQAWRRRFNRADRPLRAWAHEFCDLRGAAAHAADRNADRFVWKTRAHLAFASVLFPLLVKKKLEAAGQWSLSARDTERLRRIDCYLMHDPFSRESAEAPDHPWSELDMQALIAASARKFYPGSSPTSD